MGLDVFERNGPQMKGGQRSLSPGDRSVLRVGSWRGEYDYPSLPPLKGILQMMEHTSI